MVGRPEDLIGDPFDGLVHRQYSVGLTELLFFRAAGGNPISEVAFLLLVQRELRRSLPPIVFVAVAEIGAKPAMRFRWDLFRAPEVGSDVEQ